MQSLHLGSERRHDNQERWQLPGLTGSDAIKPEEWQEFCTKVEAPLPHGEMRPMSFSACLPDCVCVQPCLL